MNLDSLVDQLPGYWGCKDLNSVFVCVNKAFAKLMGFQKPADIVGLSDHEITSPTNCCADDFRQQDKLVIDTQCTIKVLDIHPYPDGSWRAHIFSKKPWYNNQGEVQGSIFFGQELSDIAILEVGHWICRATNPSIDTKKIQLCASNDEKLTQREEEALFLLLYGKKPTFIAEAMGISIKTFEGYVARLRSKFNAHSKAHLIELAFERGYGSQIPKTLLKTQISVILHSENAA
ncbi:helix-turn-helix transcriptional regulator [Vibrio taketomensis]|uniref:helix-turn-helix transcriptional regulator n=1 Tax=Vibrio taketomensis TaxID=2572923 RepID=UPI001389CB7B|nr:helix-turn-helix transcriptional regulator [Vibrio taketomensis]